MESNPFCHPYVFWIPSFCPEANQPLAGAGMTTKVSFQSFSVTSRVRRLWVDYIIRLDINQAYYEVGYFFGWRLNLDNNR